MFASLSASSIFCVCVSSVRLVTNIASTRSHRTIKKAKEFAHCACRLSPSFRYIDFCFDVSVGLFVWWVCYHRLYLLYENLLWMAFKYCVFNTYKCMFRHVCARHVVLTCTTPIFNRSTHRQTAFFCRCGFHLHCIQYMRPHFFFSPLTLYPSLTRSCPSNRKCR